MDLQHAINKLLNSYGDIHREGSIMVVDPYEAKEALEKAEAGSSEELVLQILVKANPIPEVIEVDIKETKAKAKKSKKAEAEPTEDAVRAAE